MDLLGGQDCHTASDGPVPHLPLDRRADADLHGSCGIDQPLVDCVVEHGPMRVDLAKIVGPGVHVCVEVNQAQGSPLPLRLGTQQRQRDAMLASQRHQVRKPRRLLLNERQAGRDVAKGDAEVPNIRDGKRGRIDPEARMGAIHQHPACVPDRLRPEAGSRAVRGPDIKRNTGDYERGVAVRPRDAEKSRWCTEGGRSGDVGSPVTGRGACLQ
jgi:hypothetical protein